MRLNETLAIPERREIETELSCVSRTLSLTSRFSKRVYTKEQKYRTHHTHRHNI